MSIGHRSHRTVVVTVLLVATALAACTGADAPPSSDPPAPFVLTVHDSNSRAIIVPVGENPEVLRINVAAAPMSTPWHVQLNRPGLSLAGGATYTVSFRVRAAALRPVSFGVSQAHAPWENLGLYQEINADTAWKNVSVHFVAKASDDSTRLHFDLGARAGIVDLDSVVLRRGR